MTDAEIAIVRSVLVNNPTLRWTAADVTAQTGHIADVGAILERLVVTNPARFRRWSSPGGNPSYSYVR